MSKAWWKAAGIRCLRTIGQTLVATLSASLAGEATNLIDINWVAILSVTVLSGALSLATSLAGLPEVTSKEHISGI